MKLAHLQVFDVSLERSDLQISGMVWRISQKQNFDIGLYMALNKLYVYKNYCFNIFNKLYIIFNR